MYISIYFLRFVLFQDSLSSQENLGPDSPHWRESHLPDGHILFLFIIVIVKYSEIIQK